MNRKDRRAQEKAAGKTKTKIPAAALMSKPQTTGNAEYEKQVGMKLKTEGKEAEAIPHLIKALELDSSFADVHFMLSMIARTKKDLGINIDDINKNIVEKDKLKASYMVTISFLRKRKQNAEALVCQEELCKLFPEDEHEKVNLALLLNLMDQKENALRLLAELMDKNPSNRMYKGVFTFTCGGGFFPNHEPLIKKALQMCFDNIYETNLYKAYSTWVNVVLNDPDCSPITDAQIKVTEDDFISWINKQDYKNLLFIKEKFFLDGIRLLIISDTIMERFLIRMRRWICLNIEKLQKEEHLKFFEQFIFALGEQCFFNEYIYGFTNEEDVVIQNLINDIKSGNELKISECFAFGLISCYSQLNKIFPEKEVTFKQLSQQNPEFLKLAKTQFFDPIEEQNIKSSLKSFGVMSNQISQNVQMQYEENPYPRWISTVSYATPNDDIPMTESDRNNPWKILVAGCGTGRQALATAAAYPNAVITAIDLSRSSLAYAQRKANESGLSNRIKFIHADILSMKDWPDQFDIIECSGVLHHMEDPFEGWSALNNLLKVGGYFKVGLYSEVARKNVIEGRKYVSNNGFESTLEGIRACREGILKKPSSDPMRKWLTRTSDFYATSLVRDLIFHVQEHRLTLPQIKIMMDNLGLICKKFIVTDAETVRLYDSMFPDDLERKNLENWDHLEQKYPDTFMSMYQFWCRKK